jgi:hypothetical protein
MPGDFKGTLYKKNQMGHYIFWSKKNNSQILLFKNLLLNYLLALGRAFKAIFLNSFFFQHNIIKYDFKKTIKFGTNMFEQLN